MVPKVPKMRACSADCCGQTPNPNVIKKLHPAYRLRVGDPGSTTLSQCTVSSCQCSGGIQCPCENQPNWLQVALSRSQPFMPCSPLSWCSDAIPIVHFHMHEHQRHCILLPQLHSGENAYHGCWQIGGELLEVVSEQLGDTTWFLFPQQQWLALRTLATPSFSWERFQGRPRPRDAFPTPQII